MNKLMTIGSLAAAGIFTAGLVATQAPAALAHGDSARGGDDSSAVVRTVDDRGRHHAEDGRHHRRHGHDDNGRHRGHHRHGHDDHGHDDRGRHGGDDD